MQSSWKTKLFTIIGAVMVGGLLGWLLCFFQFMKTQYHYRELDTFFRGTLTGKEVVGTSFFEYQGIGFLECNQWKIQLQDPYGLPFTLYQKRSSFQESTPHQPKVDIQGDTIRIDDGEMLLTVIVKSKHRPDNLRLDNRH